MAEVSLRNYQKQVEAYLRNERLEEAVAHSSHILGRYPKNATSYRVLGAALLRQGRHEEAEEIYRRLLGVYPNDYEANANLSRIYEALGQTDYALWYAERALDQRPNDRQTNERLRNLVHRVQGVRLNKIQLTAGAVANQYLKAGRTEQAIELLQGALAESPDRADLRLRLAQAFWQAGAAVEAAETALEVLQTLPYAAEANEILAQLWLSEDRPSDAQRYLSRIEAVAPYEALALALGSTPEDDAYAIDELNFAQYAASVDVDNPDWLESLGEDDFQTSEMPPINLDDDQATETYDIDELLSGFDLEEEPAADEPTSADVEDLFSDLDDLDAEPAQQGTGLTDLLGFDVEEEDREAEPPSERAPTGLTGLLNLPDEDEAEAEEDLSLDDLFASIQAEEGDLFGEEDETPSEPSSSGTILFDDQDDDFPAEQPAAEAPPSTTDFFGDLPDDWDPRAAEELASRFVDEPPAEGEDLLTEQFPDNTDWEMDSAPAEESPVDEADPLAWMRESGIEFDEQALGGTVLFDDEDEPSTIESDEADPLAWMQQSGIEYQGGDSNLFDIPEEELRGAVPPPDDTMEFDDPQGPPPPADMLYEEPDDPEAAGDEWLADDDILDEMLNLEALTDDPGQPDEAADDLFADMDWQATMNDQPERPENDNPPGDDNFEWLDDDQFQDELPPAEDEMGDPMAWLNEVGAELADEEAEDEAEPLEDPMAWLNEVGAELDEDAPESGFDPQTSVTDMFADSGPLEQQQMGATDYLSEGGEEDSPQQEPPESQEEPRTPTGLTGMLSRADEIPPQAADADDESATEAELDWLSELEGEQPEAQALDWLSDESGEAPPAEGMDWGELGPAFTDQLPDVEGDQQPEEAAPWSAFEQGFTEEMDSDELNWLADEPQMQEDPWAGLGSEPQPTAEDPGEPPADADDWLDAFQQEDSEELDWLSALDEDAEPPAEAPEPAEPISAEEDPFGFGELAAEEPEAEPAADAAWLDDLMMEDSREEDPFAAPQEPQEEEAEPAAANWLNEFAPSGDIPEGAEEEDFFASFDAGLEDESLEDDLIGTYGEQAEDTFPVSEADLNWLDATEGDEEEPLDFDMPGGEPLPFEEERPAAREELPDWDAQEDDITPAPTGMTDFLQTIRDDEVEAPSFSEAPEEEFFAEEAFAAQTEPSAQEGDFDWGDLDSGFEDEAELAPGEPAAEAGWLDDFDEFEEEGDFFPAAAAEEEPTPALDTADDAYEEEALYDEPGEYEEELDFAPTDNVPDWLNAMVPGLDINYTAEEDAPIEDRYEEGVSHRARILTESERSVTSTSDFRWLQDIVDEEISVGDGEDRGADGGRRRQRFVFSRLPRWLARPRRGAQAVAAPPTAAPDAQTAEDDLDELPDFNLDDFDDLDDDFEFDDLQ